MIETVSKDSKPEYRQTKTMQRNLFAESIYIEESMKNEFHSRYRGRQNNAIRINDRNNVSVSLLPPMSFIRMNFGNMARSPRKKRQKDILKKSKAEKKCA